MLSSALALFVAFAPPSFDEGAKAFEAQDYERAAELFAELAKAGDEAPPEVLFAWGQSLRMLGECEAAEHAFRRYLATGVSLGQLEAVETLIVECPVAGSKEEEEASWLVPVGPLPVSQPSEDEPAQGQSPPVQPPQAPRPQKVYGSRSDPGREWRVGGIISMAAGSATLLGGVGGSVYFAERSSFFQREYDNQGCPENAAADCTTISDNGRASNLYLYAVGVPLMAVGAIGVGLGAWLYVRGKRVSRDWLTSVTVAPWGRGVAISGRF